jgi:hypothetical protein
MPTVSVDVDLEDIDTDDLVSELCSRMKRKCVSANDKKELQETFRNSFNSVLDLPEVDVQVRTLDDRMKAEHLTKVWDKYNSAEFEKLMP